MPIASVNCLSWNIHRAKGADGRVDPGRIADVLLTDILPQNRPHILSLQEADHATPPHAGFLDLDRIEADSGLRHIHTAPHLRWGPQSHGFLGTILFLDAALTVDWADVIDLPGHCHRGAVVVETSGIAQVRVITMHLSLSQALRMVQMRIVGQYLRRRPRMQTILIGDLNEWRPWGGMALSQHLIGERFHGPTRATFPARRPLLPLDRILTNRADAVHDLRAVSSLGIRAASDHLPLWGRVNLDRKVSAERSARSVQTRHPS